MSKVHSIMLYQFHSSFKSRVAERMTAVKRSDSAGAIIKCKKLQESVLPLNVDVISHYYFLRKFYSNTDPKFFKKLPYFNDLKDDTVNDVIKLWKTGKTAGLPVISSIRIQTKLKNIISKFEAVKKRAKTKKSGEVGEEWMNDLFDICKCKCKITENPRAFNVKLACNCPWEDRILEIEGPFLIDQRSVRKLFLIDQRSVRKLMISFRRNMAFTNKQQQAQAKLKWRQTDIDYLDQPCTSREDQLVLLKRLRSNSCNLSTVCDISEARSESSHDPEYTDCKTTSTGGKNYTKAEESCILGDRRLTSIRQQFDQLLSVVNTEKIAPSPSTIFRKREQCRLKALRR